jgi:hypothetical protein
LGIDNGNSIYYSKTYKRGFLNMWTCCECENHYNSNTGDTDERMCHKCLDAQYEIWMEEIETLKKESDKEK